MFRGFNERTWIAVAAILAFAGSGKADVLTIVPQPGLGDTGTVSLDSTTLGRPSSIVGAGFSFPIDVLNINNGQEIVSLGVNPTQLGLSPAQSAALFSALATASPPAIEAVINGSVNTATPVGQGANFLVFPFTPTPVAVPTPSGAAGDAASFQLGPNAVQMGTTTVVTTSAGGTSFTLQTIDPPIVPGDEVYGLIGQDGNGGLTVAFSPSVTAPVGQTFDSVFGVPEATVLGYFANPTGLLTSPTDVTTIANALLNNAGLLPALNQGNGVQANLVDFGITGGVEQGGVADGTADLYWNPAAAAAPEPASLTLLAVGMAGLAGFAWRRQKQVAVAALANDLLHPPGKSAGVECRVWRGRI